MPHVGTVPPQLVTDLRDKLELARAVETGTFHGTGTNTLAAVFPRVVTIELSPDLHERARKRFADQPHVELLLGDSGRELSRVVDRDTPTLYFLDGHWSGGETAHGDAECPVLDELEALVRGNPDDCILVDDARLFVDPPPPPHQRSEWPSIEELLGRIRAIHPGHYVVVVDDQIVAVPGRARGTVKAWQRNVRSRPLRRQLVRFHPERMLRSLRRRIQAR